MKKFLCVVTLIFAVVLLNIGTSEAFWVWTPKTGKWVNPKSVAKDTPKAQYDYAMRFFKDGQYDSARKEFEKVVKIFPSDKLSAQSQFYIGECYMQLGYYYKAFEAYQKVVDEYPYYKRTALIISKEFDIAQKYLSGEKYKTMGIALLPAYMKAGDIFKKVQENSPSGAYADKALFYAGEAYMKADMPQEAIEMLSKMIKEYPKSEYLEKAQFAIADINLRLSKKPDYDDKGIESAISDFEQYIKEHPESEFTQEAKDSLNMLKQRKAEHLFRIAQFYEGLGDYDAADTYYNKLLKEYPDFSRLDAVKIRLREIENIIYGDYIQIVQVPSEKSDNSKSAKEGQTVGNKNTISAVELDRVVRETEMSIKNTKSAFPSSFSAKPVKVNAKSAVKEKVEIKEIKCINYDEIANVKIAPDSSFNFVYYTLEEPFRLVIDPVEDVVTKQKKQVVFDKGLVRSIKIVSPDDYLSEKKDVSDLYRVDYVIVEFFKNTPYEVVQYNDDVVVKAGSYLEDILKLKQSQGK